MRLATTLDLSFAIFVLPSVCDTHIVADRNGSAKLEIDEGDGHGTAGTV